jgi:hypothetical protein
LTSSEANSTFACRIYASGTTPPAFGACSGSDTHTASGLSPGTYVFETQATDPFGNTDPSPASRTFTVTSGGGSPGGDSSPPDTLIDSAPKKKVAKKKAKFAFHSTEAGSTFQCSLDGAAFAPCSSPLKLKVGKGKHTLRVRAVDAAGNVDPTPAKHRWKRKPKRRR